MSVARSAGQNTVREREKWATNAWRERRHNISHHGDPERSQSSPRLFSQPSLCSLSPIPSLNLPCCFPRRWMGIRGSPRLSKRHKDKWKSSAEKPVFSLCLSADHFGLLSPKILRRPSLGSSFHFQAAYYSLHHDLTSTQTESLSVHVEWWECSLTKVIPRKGRRPLRRYSERPWEGKVLGLVFITFSVGRTSSLTQLNPLNWENVTGTN